MLPQVNDGMKDQKPQGSTAYTFSGDFTLYDHLLDHSFNFGVVPQRYVEQKLSPLDTYFGMLLQP